MTTEYKLPEPYFELLGGYTADQMQQAYQAGRCTGVSCGDCPTRDYAPAHTDHPMRHHDRTCPAYQEPVNEVVGDNEDITMSWLLKLPMPVGTKLFTHPAKQDI